MSRSSVVLGMVTGGVVVLGALVAGVVSQPGATMRTIQAQQIDAMLGEPIRLGAGDEELFTWVHGPVDAPTVVLVHGFGDAGAGWSQVALALADNHRVVVLDLPGHGRSAPRGGPITFDALDSGLERALDGEKAGLTLVGNSLGGWLAARYALAHPDKVGALVLVNNAGLTQELDEQLLLPATRERMREKNVAVMGQKAPDMPDFFLDGLIALHQDPRLAGLFRHIQADAPRLDQDLAGLEVPTTLVWGTPDPFFPVEGYLDRMAAATGATPVLLEGCGHAPQYGCSAETADAIAAVAAR